MNNKKWLIGSAAVVAAATIVLAGCSQGAKEPGDSTAPAASKEPGASAAPEASKEPEVRRDISVSVYDRGNVPAAEGTIEDNRWTKWLSENGPANLKFVAIPRFESQQKLNVLFASGSAPDLIFEYAPHIKQPLIDQKLIMPLDELIEEHSATYKEMLKQYPQLKKVGTKADGKLYEFARMSEVVPVHALFIREDWLKKLNLQVPQTTEELYAVAKAFAEQDPDGNGEKDTYGIAISHQSGHVVDQIFQATRWGVKNGQLEYNWANFQESLAFKKKLFDEGIVDKDFLNDNNGAKAKQDFINGKIGIYPIQPSSWPNFATTELASLKKNVPTAAVQPIPYPKSPAGQFIPALQNPVQAVAMINAKAKYPEAVVKYIDFLLKPETRNTLRHGIEGTHWKLGANGCPEVIDAEKKKNEISWNGDMQMMSSMVLDPKCGKLDNSFNLNDPIQKEGYEIYLKAKQIYMDASKPYVDITHPEHMPSLPKDLETISNPLTKQVDDMLKKGIIDGAASTPEKTIQEMQEAWNKGDGKKIEDWFKNWYATESENAFLAKDIIEVMKQQQAAKE
ncbi:extracellular solute-binding protein [Paenibacillus sp.]|uniref:extracellular solute-binding protein n=1 Tax=Paenibacillus sp. TaxID=58172 RepID=UPI0028125CDE|nr:extracellular solute-binding protein [Paenibacillus sp.]